MRRCAVGVRKDRCPSLPSEPWAGAQARTFVSRKTSRLHALPSVYTCDNLPSDDAESTWSHMLAHQGARARRVTNPDEATAPRPRTYPMMPRNEFQLRPQCEDWSA